MKTRGILTTWLFLVASGCDAGLEAANGRAGSVCATCEPEVGGDTGDFGGEPTPCWGLSSAVAVGVEEASALGFDVDELERRLARDTADGSVMATLHGEAWSPTVFLDLGNDRGEDYWPLGGAFGQQR